MEKTYDRSAELRRGILVFLALAVLTVVEYFIGVLEGGILQALLLWAMIMLKAGLVLWFFMHLRRVFSSEGGH